MSLEGYFFSNLVIFPDQLILRYQQFVKELFGLFCLLPFSLSFHRILLVGTANTLKDLKRRGLEMRQPEDWRKGVWARPLLSLEKLAHRGKWARAGQWPICPSLFGNLRDDICWCATDPKRHTVGNMLMNHGCLRQLFHLSGNEFT